MSEMFCAYTGDREAALMDYLYDEMTADARAEFDTHLASCARCRVELSSFGRVRRQLGEWQPPDYVRLPSRATNVEPSPSTDDETTRRRDDETTRRRTTKRRSVPMWAQVAAAMLVLGVSAGLANLDVKYDANGFSVRTGWSTRANPASVADAAIAANPSPWRADLAALERALRGEIQAASQERPRPVVAPTTSDAELLRRVKALVDDSERRQQSELALRIADVLREVNARRDADLRKIDANFTRLGADVTNFGVIQRNTGAEMMKNRQILDYYLQRVSQRQ